MASGDIQGTVTDASGNPISGLTIYLINEDNPSQVKTTTTDANGNYLFDGHPDAQTDSDNYHVVAGAYDDGTDLFNTFSKPQVTADLRAPFFDVAISSTNDPVVEGNDLNVDYSVNNTGFNGTQDITLEIDSTQEDIDSGVTISGGGSTTGTLTWPTVDGEAGDYTATVLSDDDNASTSVTIENAIPDSVASRPNDDDSTSSVTLRRGLEILVNDDFGEIGARISNNTSGVTRAYLLDSSENVLDETDVSGLSSGDAFTLAASMTGGNNYIVAVDAEGANYTIGFRNNETAYPYSSTDVDITGRYKSDIGVDAGNVHAVNDIGNTGF